MNNDDRNELSRLLAALIDHRLAEDDQARLGELLKSSAEARDQYLEYCELDADLARLADLPAAARAAAPAKPMPAGRGLFVGAMISTAAALLLWFSLRGDKRPEALAAVSHSTAACWNGPIQPAASSELFAGRLDLAAGEVRFSTARGTEVTLSGPCVVELLEVQALRVVRGKVAVRVREAGIGFRVFTPTADVIDLGTEFGISVDEAGATEVHVVRGVVVAKPGGGGGVVPILRHEAARIDSLQGDVTHVDYRPEQFPAFATAAATVDTTNSTAPSVDVQPLPTGARVAFLGDRMTDRETHLLLVNQTLARSLPVADRPQLFNVGVSLPLSFDEAAFERLIVPLQPTHAVLEFGTEIALAPTPRTIEVFTADIARLLDRLQQAGIMPVVETGFPLGPGKSEAQQLLDGYNAALRRLAADRKLQLIDVARAWQTSPADLSELLAPNGQWLSFAGHRRLAGDLLAAWGFAEVAVDEVVRTEMLPRVIRRWRLHTLPNEEPLTLERTAELLPSSSGETLELPQAEDRLARRSAEQSQSITYRDRARGYATNLRRSDAVRVVAVAELEEPAARAVYFNTGAMLQTIWLNGEKIYQAGPTWTGWHAGKERIAATLKVGRNTVVVEAGDSFFLSVTDALDWPLP